MKSPQILIAGGTGTNGHELLKQLSGARIKARALVRNLAKASYLANEYVELVRGDLGVPSSLQEAFDGIDKAYVVTAVHPDSDAWFENFFNAAKSRNVQRLIKLSAYGAAVDAPSEVLRGHGRSDNALIASGVPYTILRPNTFYQNMFWYAESIQSTRSFSLPLGDSMQSQVDVRDLAEATVRILSEPGHENRIYALTGPESISHHDIADAISQTFGKTITYVSAPPEVARASMLRAGVPEWNANAIVDIMAAFATGRYANVEPDLPKLLGRPARAFVDFARDYMAVFEPLPMTQ